jgi:hypothetical protein
VRYLEIVESSEIDFYLLLQRIAELMRKKNKQRLAKAAELARKEAAGDYSHLQNKKGEFISKPLPQPTLPSIALDDLERDSISIRTRAETDNKWQKEFTYPSNVLPDGAPAFPPMPPYQAYAHSGYDYQQDAASVHDHSLYVYDDRYTESQVALTHAAAPISGHLAAATGALPNPYSVREESFLPSVVDAHDYNGGLAYDDHSQSRYGYQHNNSQW